MVCETLGRPLRFMLTAGQRHDRAYDNNDLRQAIAEMEAQAVIPSTRSRKTPIPHDETIYKGRNRIERCFNKLTSAASHPLRP